MNVVEPILYQCKFNPSGKAICTPGSAVESMTYGELERAIHNVARTALSRGLAPGMRVAIAVRETLLHAVLVLGLVRLGITTTWAGSTPLSRLHIDAVISENPRAHSGERILLADRSWMEGDGTPLDYARIYSFNEDNLCDITVTSGTTGEAKAVGLSHRIINRRMATDLFSKGPRFARPSPSYSDFGLGTSAGFRQMLSQLWSGSTIYFLGSDSSAILEAFDRGDIRSMIVAPFGLGQFVKVFEDEPALKCSLDHISCVGAALSPALAERVYRRMSEKLYSWYATTEAGTTAFGELRRLASIPGAAGHVVPGVTLEIVDGNGKILPAKSEGAIRVRSAVMTDGYLGDSATTAQFFRDGYFYSGDLGYLTADDVLVLTGRAQTILNLGGHKEKPETIEDVLMQFAGIEQAAVFSMPDEFRIDEPWALLVARAPFDEAALRKHCEGKLVDVAVPARFIRVETIPRGVGGKIERHRLRAIAEEMGRS